MYSTTHLSGTALTDESFEWAEEEAKWFRKAAAQGNAKAQDNLGKMYYFGDRFAHDCGMALRLFQASAAQGNSDAEYHLGMMYDEGDCVRRDPGEAERWYRKSAARGNAQAKSALAGR